MRTTSRVLGIIVQSINQITPSVTVNSCEQGRIFEAKTGGSAGGFAYLKVWLDCRRGGGAGAKCRLNRIKVMNYRMEIEMGHISN
jgi:hypothetical protein